MLFLLLLWLRLSRVFCQIVFIICTWGPPYRYCTSETFTSLFIFKCILQVLQFNNPRQGIPWSAGIRYYRWLNDDGSVYMTAGVRRWWTSTRTSKLEHFLTAVPLNPCKTLKSDSRWLKSPSPAKLKPKNKPQPFVIQRHDRHWFSNTVCHLMPSLSFIFGIRSDRLQSELLIDPPSYSHVCVWWRRWWSLRSPSSSPYPRLVPLGLPATVTLKMLSLSWHWPAWHTGYIHWTCTQRVMGCSLFKPHLWGTVGSMYTRFLLMMQSLKLGCKCLHGRIKSDWGNKWLSVFI